MQTRRIGTLEVSAVGLGCNNFGRRMNATDTKAVVHAALDAGVTLFDTADIYGGTLSEEYLGRALGRRRDDVVLATKFGMKVDEGRDGAHPAYVKRACEDSLKRLGTDRIDLYQLHRPDPAVPIADTLGALDDLVRAGKVREIGCSNFTVAQLEEAARAAAGRSRFVSVQNEYSLLHREPEGSADAPGALPKAGVLEACGRLGVAFIPFFPLASGLLTGKYRAGQGAPAGSRLAGRGEPPDPAKLAVVERLRAVAEGRGHTLLELAFSWLLARPAVASVIAGATSPEQVRSNVAAAGWALTAAELAMVEGAAPNE